MIDIRHDVPGLWCDDITFCSEKCEWGQCPRNQKNIRDRTVPHSFSIDIPGDCPKLLEGRRSKMTDKENVIKGLETHIKPNSRCVGCPYPNNGLCGDQLYHDALSLIKEQESVIEALKSDLDETLKVLGEQPEIVRCGDCKHFNNHPMEHGLHYGECDNGIGMVNHDWFCADGKGGDM